MENLNRIWRAFFAIGLIGIAVQQFIFSDFRPVILPPAYPSWLAPRMAWAWVVSLLLIITCIMILLEMRARQASLLMGTLLLLILITLQFPGTPYPRHIGSWTNAFKELTLAGGLFIVAGSIPESRNTSDFMRLLARLIPAGKCFFAITLILFGSMHFVYPDFCASLVPNWMPWHYFWMYFGAVCLILGGFGILIAPVRRTAALLTGIMLFIWVFILHLPRALAAPPTDGGNEWTSVFEAFAFSGMAFLIAAKAAKRSR